MLQKALPAESKSLEAVSPQIHLKSKYLYPFFSSTIIPLAAKSTSSHLIRSDVHAPLCIEGVNDLFSNYLGILGPSEVCEDFSLPPTIWVTIQGRKNLYTKYLNPFYYFGCEDVPLFSGLSLQMNLVGFGVLVGQCRTPFLSFGQNSFTGEHSHDANWPLVNKAIWNVTLVIWDTAKYIFHHFWDT